jgi:microcin C transport system permease protein
VTSGASVISIITVPGLFLAAGRAVFQRLHWASLYVIIILFAILGRSFWLLVFLTILFGWPALVGVVRAEFLRAQF